MSLKNNKIHLKSVSWIVKIDLEKYFDKVNHDRLLEVLSVYCDQATIEFIRKLLKISYVDIHNLADKANYNTKVILQDSPHIFNLSNIFIYMFLMSNCKQIITDL